jgi:hypothetical protein
MCEYSAKYQSEQLTTLANIHSARSKQDQNLNNTINDKNKQKLNRPFIKLPISRKMARPLPPSPETKCPFVASFRLSHHGYFTTALNCKTDILDHKVCFQR